MPTGVYVPAQLNDLAVDVQLSATPAQGSVLYRGVSKWNDLAPGTAGQVLTSGGASANPSWTTVDLSTKVSKAGDTMTGALTLENRLIDTSTGSATNDNTQDSVRIQPGGAVAAHWRSLAIYKTSSDTTPRVWVDKDGVLNFLTGSSGEFAWKASNSLYHFNGSSGAFVGDRLYLICSQSKLTLANQHFNGMPVRFDFNGTAITAVAGTFLMDLIIPSGEVVGMRINGYASQTAHLLDIFKVASDTTASLFVDSGAHLNFADGINVILGTSTGTKIGTATGQKLGFFNATPVVQQTGGAATAAGTYGATEQGMLQKAYDALRTFGFLS